MLVEFRQSHLRHSTDPTAASLHAALRPATARRSAHSGEAQAAGVGLSTSDLSALYPAIFADESPARSSAGGRQIVRRLVQATALIAQLSFSAVWHLIR